VSVCGIDLGSLATPADVAWLEGTSFLLDRYVPSPETPLPEPPAIVDEVAVFAIDAPQSLPAPGAARRTADREANTPTRVLPAGRHERAPIYTELVEAGLTVFWTAHARGLPLIETYPRFTIKTLWPELRIPPKRRQPERYVAELWALIRSLGYTSRPPSSHHEIDAMLCALAAEAYAAGTFAQVGEPLAVDTAEEVLREGYIVVPGPRPPKPFETLPEPRPSGARRERDPLARSRPWSRSVDGAALRAFLEDHRYCILATTSPAGRPQARPVAFILVGESLWFPTIASARLRNLEASPWGSVAVSQAEGNLFRAAVADGPIVVHRQPPTGLLARWEERFGSIPGWAAAWLELRPARLFSSAAAD
jgi:predicted nuclease with RNAse H fold